MKIINKTIFRDLKKHFFRYLAMMLLILAGTYFVVAAISASTTIEDGISERNKTNNVEDGSFVVFSPLSEDSISGLEKDGVDIEEGFYLDYQLEDDSTLRTFINREKINQLDVVEGKLADASDEISIEKQYAAAHGYGIGDSIIIADQKFTIVGTVAAPDYETVIENVTDSTADNWKFGIAFLTDEAYGALKNTGLASKTQTYQYFYKYTQDSTLDDKALKDILQESQINVTETDDENLINYIVEQDEDLSAYDGDVKELLSGNGFDATLEDANEQLSGYIQEELTRENYYQTLTDLASQISSNPMISDGESLSKDILELRDGLEELSTIDASSFDIDNLISFETAENNSRIGEVLSDISIVKEAGLLGGLVIFILIVYVVSIFTVHEVDLQSAIIGTLYSMGMKKRTLMMRYILLPVAVTLVGGILGTIIGFTPQGTGIMVDSLIATYSLPEFQTVYPGYLILYGLVVPPLTSAIVNIIVLNRRLSRQPLSLLRNEQKQNKASSLKLKKWKFANAFKFRQFLRESRSAIAIIVGVILSTMMLMMSQYISVGLGNMGKNMNEDVTFNYMYLLKYPSQKYTDGERACIESLNAKSVVDNTTTFNVSIVGTQEDSKYFDFEVSDSKDEITISSCAAIKFELEEGDTLTLFNEMDDTEYTFTVSNIVPYSGGLYVFMNIDTLRELFEEEDDYYNALFSDSELTIDSGDLFTVTEKSDLIDFVDVFVENMSPMIYLMYGLSIVVFFAVLYLMMKVMIDHSAFSISMMRVFGYRDNEIRKMYLDGNFVVFIVAAILAIPLSKGVMSKKWPQMVDHVALGIDVSFSWQNYVIMAATMLIVYFTVSAMLNHGLKKQMKNAASDILKTRE